MEIFVIYNDNSQIQKLKDSNIEGFYLHAIDERTKAGKKEAFQLKGSFGAKETPFIIIYNKDIPIKGFWKEASDDPIQECINFLIENDKLLHSIEV